MPAPEGYGTHSQVGVTWMWKCKRCGTLIPADAEDALTHDQFHNELDAMANKGRH